MIISLLSTLLFSQENENNRLCKIYKEKGKEANKNEYKKKTLEHYNKLKKQYCK